MKIQNFCWGMIVVLISTTIFFDVYPQYWRIDAPVCIINLAALVVMLMLPIFTVRRHEETCATSNQPERVAIFSDSPTDWADSGPNTSDSVREPDQNNVRFNGD